MRRGKSGAQERGHWIGRQHSLKITRYLWFKQKYSKNVQVRAYLGGAAATRPPANSKFKRQMHISSHVKRHQLHSQNKLVCPLLISLVILVPFVASCAFSSLSFQALRVAYNQGECRVCMCLRVCLMAVLHLGHCWHTQHHCLALAKATKPALWCSLGGKVAAYIHDYKCIK